MIRGVIMLFFLAIGWTLSAQTFIQLEKSGSYKTERFYQGDLLLFQLEGEEGWFEETIEEIYVEESLVLFTNRIVPISKISAIRDLNRFAFMKGLGNKLLVFSATFLTYSLLATLVGWNLSVDTAIIGGGAFVIGAVIKIVYKHKTWKIKGRKRLRAISLDMQPGAA